MPWGAILGAVAGPVIGDAAARALLARHPGPAAPAEAGHGLLRRLQRLPRRRMERRLPTDWR